MDITPVEADKFAGSLLSGIKRFLSQLGVSAPVVDQLDPVIYLVLIIILAFFVEKIVRYLAISSVRKVLTYRKINALKTMIQYKVINKVTSLIFPLFIIMLLPFALQGNPRFLDIVEKICWIYFVIVLTISSNAFFSALFEVISGRSDLRDRPMKGLVQIIQVLIVFMAVIVIVAILVDKSPIHLITGLGAFAAVLMLVFKDSIMGFVSGVLLSQNDMVRIGDWIEMTNNPVNGVVIDITLNTVKIQNFDNTIVTIPPYSLISGAFINWRGMSDSGGRRIMRSYTIDTDNVQFCTPAFLEEMKKIDILREYITQKQAEQAAAKVQNTDNTAGLVNGTIETNLGLFRAYMTLYLQQHPFINKELLLMVRTLAPTPNGLPLQIYCFSANKNWVSYESIQAEVMEHFTAILPRFGLYPFQNATGRDYINSSILEVGGKIETLNGIPWDTIKQPATVTPVPPEGGEKQ